MSLEVYRQGDLCFIPIKPNEGQTPWAVGAKVLKRRVIRRGEHGGVHAIEKEAKDVVFYELNGVRYILSPEGVGIVHGEHRRLELPPGTYEVRVQREGQPRGTRFVRD